MRRGARALVAASGLALAIAGAAAGARAEDAPRAGEMTPDVDQAVEEGLDRLIALQNPTSGEWGTPTGQYAVASTALAGLAILASGDVCDRGPRAEAVERAIHYLLHVAQTRPAPDEVLFVAGRPEQGKMHSHGLAMLFLAECYGMSGSDGEIREALEGAIRLTVRSQTAEGGWGYHTHLDPEWKDDEASVTITQIQALRACRNAGFAVDAGVIHDAVAYVRRSMTADGSCRYSLTMKVPEARNTSYELTAAAVSTLYSAGAYDDEKLALGLNYLRRSLARRKSPGGAASNFYFYGNLYAAHVMFQAGGSDWQTWYAGMRDELLRKQRPDGGWDDEGRKFGEPYATASALLILQFPRRYLPIYTD